MAEAMRNGFADVFQKNEFAYNLSDDKLKNLIVEITGKEPNDGTVTAIVGSFKACKQLADFDVDPKEALGSSDKVEPLAVSKSIVKHEPATQSQPSKEIRLSYTININLPETSDVKVFNAIFSSIKQNLLTDD